MTALSRTPCCPSPNLSRCQHTDPIVIREVRTDHADVAALADEVQAYYVEHLRRARTSARWTTTSSRRRAGRSISATTATAPVSMGGWRYHEPIEGFAAERPGRDQAHVRRAVGPRSRPGPADAAPTWSDSAVAAGADALILETGRVQPDAIALYRSSGFVDIPDFGFYAGEALAVHLGKLLR